jgi:hypothetical protein
MAEIMLLILFMLLLTFGMLVAERERENSQLKMKLSQYSNVSKFLDELRSQDPGVSISDIIKSIDRQQRAMSALEKENADLKSEVAADVAVRDIIKEIQRSRKDSTSAEVIKQLQDLGNLKAQVQNSKGQIAQLTSQIKASGKGNEFPSCWVTADGKPQSIFELVLGTGGVTINNHEVVGRQADWAALPIQGVPIGREIGFAEFSAVTLPLYSWSVQHGCRFYVIRYSTVESAPIDGINQISNKFYPDSSIMRITR